MSYRLLNSSEVQNYLNLTSAEVERLVKDHEIPFEKRGGRAVFPAEAIDAWASRRILRASVSHLEGYERKSAPGHKSVPGGPAFLGELLKPSHISARIEAKTKPSVLRQMAALANSTGLLADAAELVGSLEEREEICSTAVPGGVALLHPKSMQPYRFVESFVVLGRTAEPVFFGAPDREATDLFFLICCVEDRAHLQTLARLCLLLQTTGLLGDLRAAPDASAMHECILDAEETALRAVLGDDHSERHHD